jgi:hypothetical protein
LNVNYVIAKHGEALVETTVDAVDRRAHHGDRHDADDHAKRRQKRANLVGPNLIDGNVQALARLVPELLK